MTKKSRMMLKSHTQFSNRSNRQSNSRLQVLKQTPEKPQLGNFNREA